MSYVKNIIIHYWDTILGHFFNAFKYLINPFRLFLYIKKEPQLGVCLVKGVLRYKKSDIGDSFTEWLWMEQALAKIITKWKLISSYDSFNMHTNGR